MNIEKRNFIAQGYLTLSNNSSMELMLNNTNEYVLYKFTTYNFVKDII